MIAIYHNNHVVYGDRHFPHMILLELQKSTASVCALDFASDYTPPLPRKKTYLAANTWAMSWTGAMAAHPTPMK